MKISRASVRRFIYFVLRIEPPQFCVHQTLTFSPQVFDAPVAKKKIKRLLDNLHKRFEMASLYVLEAHQSGAWHFHVLFLFYPENDLPCAPSRLDTDFRRLVLTAWKRHQTGKLEPRANATNVLATIDPWYLLKTVEIARPDEKIPRSRFRWWDAWNQALFAKHQQPLDKQAVERAFSSCKTVISAAATASTDSKIVQTEPYGPKELAREKSEINARLEIRGKGYDWETVKRRETGRDRKVSDADYILFRNGLSQLRGESRTPSIKRLNTDWMNAPEEALPF